MSRKADTTTRTTIAGVLAWLIPGAGHWYLGHRSFAVLFCCAVSLPYLTGVAIGGVKTTVNPYLNRWLFLAEMGSGGLTTGFLLLNNAVGEIDPRSAAAILRRDPGFEQQPQRTRRAQEELLHPYVSYYPTSDVAQIYLAVAGLLNLLAILDAMMRAQTNGLPVFYHEVATRKAAAEGGSGT